MYSDWSVEMAEDAPVLFVPWTDESGRLAYVDLWSHPERVGSIPEAAQHPALGRALLALNSAASNISTAKCDVWPLDASDLAACADLLDLAESPDLPDSPDSPDSSQDDEAAAGEESGAAFGFGGYIDTLLREAAAFVSLDLHLELLRNLAKGAAMLDYDHASAEFVLRRCVLLADDTTTVGHAVTMYVYAVAGSERTAYARWIEALGAVTELMLEL